LTRYKKNRRTVEPYLGVSVSDGVITQLLKQQSSPMVTELKEASTYAGLNLYFFSNSDINMKKKRIKAVYYNPIKRLWEKQEYEYPNIIYRRNIIPRKFEKQLIELGVVLLNYLRGFNKWKVYENLSKNKDFSQYLPLTLIYKKPSDLQKLYALVIRFI